MNKKISNILKIEIILIVIVIVGGFIWLKNNINQNKDATQNNLEMISKKSVEIGKQSSNKNHNIEELGISFSYPTDWGDVKETIFDGSGKSESFKFSNVKNSQLGGMHEDYFVERGGSLLDCDGFVTGKSLCGQEVIWERDKYTTSSSGLCAYSTHKFWFDGYVYHAICGLNNEKMSGFNFAFGSNKELPEISKKEFIELVESIKIN